MRQILRVVPFAIGAVLCAESATGQGRAESVTGPGSQWREFRSDAYAVAFRYPPDMVMTMARGTGAPPPVFRVAVQDARIAAGPTAEYEPPRFAVDVYDAGRAGSIEAWLDSTGAPGLPRLVREPVTVGGATGLKVTSQTFIAPNVFYYVLRGHVVYRFTPSGPLSDQVLQSVRFLR